MKLNTPEQVMKLLRLKGRASAAEVGANTPLMKTLVASGHVTTDGTIKTGRKGKPPVAWVPTDFDGPLPEPVEARPARKAITETALAETIRDVLAGPSGRQCHCVRDTWTVEQIRAAGCGCTNPQYVCPALDAVRRRANLVSPAEVPEDE